MVGHLPGLQLSVGDGRDLFWAVQKSPTVSVSSSHSAPMRQVFFAYGAQRALRDAPELLAGRLSSLFIPGRSRMDPVDWLLRLDHARKSDPDGPFDAQFERVRAALVRLLPGVEGVRVGKPDRDAVASRKLETPVEALTHEGWLPIQALSLGYQGMLAWVVDLAAGLMEAYPDAEDPLAEPAVCLVDELDLHLHPAWQQQIVDHLTGIFRRTQFVVTAHSPLVIQPAAGFANVALLRREGDHVVIENDPELVRTWRVDQILTSELFGLRSARDPRVDALMDERARILADGPDAAGWARVRAIDEELGPVDAFEDPEHRRTMGELRGLLERLQSTG